MIDRLLDALGETDEAAMRAVLADLLADLPRLAEAAAASDADASLLERILSDAVGAGFADSAETKKGCAVTHATTNGNDPSWPPCPTRRLHSRSFLQQDCKGFAAFRKGVRRRRHGQWGKL